MSSDTPPEFFLDRSLGKTTAHRLRLHGHVIHLIADHYSDDAQAIVDEDWIAEGCGHGWLLLTKDQRIRYRARELEALHGQLFCLADGNATVATMTDRFIRAMPAILRVASQGSVGFWHVYADGSIKRMWP